MEEMQTTVAVQHFLDELGRRQADVPAETIIRALLGRSSAGMPSRTALILFSA
jgi:hypothetical protein